MKVSLILTVLNEGDHIRRLLDSVAAQTQRPDEVVICDGGSGDNTVAVIQEYAERLPLKIVFAARSSISQGRNAAIREASGEIIAVTDAGVWLEREWLEELLKAGGWMADDGRTTTDDGQVSSVVRRPSSKLAMVAGFYKSDPQTTFELALGATTIPELRDIHPAKFLPSSRSVAFRKEAWVGVGGYPEWLDFSEDVIFDLKMREKFGAFAFAPKAIAHFRPRTSLAAFAKQYFNYAKGDGRAGLWPKIHFVRYFTYLVAAPLLIYVALTLSAWVWLLAVIAGLAYVRKPLERLTKRTTVLENLADWVVVLLWIPIIRVTGDIAKMIGYPAGVWDRVKYSA